MANFIIKTPNPNYNGLTEGVKFKDGFSTISNKAVADILVSDYGYELVKEPKEEEVVKETVEEVVEEQKEEKKSQSKTKKK